MNKQNNFSKYLSVLFLGSAGLLSELKIENLINIKTYAS